MLDPKKYKKKNYIHFDHKIDIGKVESYVTNPGRIAEHSFLPFIYYVTSFEKYIGEKNPKVDNRPVKNKNRHIMYAGHLDNYIYKYYAEELNRKYNKWAERNNIDECSTAYRNNKEGNSNIEFAADVINTIVNYGDAYIMVGDFTQFFDKIDHRMLKKRLLKVLGINRFEKDWYNIYRSITKFGYYEKSLLTEQFGTQEQFRYKKMNSYFNQLKEFRRFQKEHPCKKNRSSFGIPQGTAISAVFANVYATGFDVSMKEISDHYLGIYRRYSDDFVLVIPKEQNNRILSLTEFKKLEMKVREISNSNRIEIQESKTELLEYKEGKILSLEHTKDRLDYLGFIFDGESVKMRGKSPYKFYREAYNLIDRAKKVKYKKGLTKIPYRKQIYGLYTDLGIERGEYGNFISYARRAQDRFDNLSPNTDNIMMRQIKSRKKKIEKRLGVNIHTTMS